MSEAEKEPMLTLADLEARVDAAGIIQAAQDELAFHASRGNPSVEVAIIGRLLALVETLANPIHTAYRTMPLFKTPAKPGSPEARTQEIFRDACKAHLPTFKDPYAPG